MRYQIVLNSIIFITSSNTSKNEKKKKKTSNKNISEVLQLSRKLISRINVENLSKLADQSVPNHKNTVVQLVFVQVDDENGIQARVGRVVYPTATCGKMTPQRSKINSKYFLANDRLDNSFSSHPERLSLGWCTKLLTKNLNLALSILKCATKGD